MLKTVFDLRQYQTDFIKNLGHAIKKHKRVIGCAATGSGKSKTFLQIAVNAINKGYTVLIITEARKIFKQLIDEVHAIEIKDGSNLDKIKQNNIYLAMAQTLRLRQNLIDQFKFLSEIITDTNKGVLIINDECHINQATGILLQLPNAMLIGFSGSPVGKHLIKLYNNLVVGPQPHELVLAGFLSPYKHFERKKADLSQLELNSIGEYPDESNEKVFSSSEVYDGLLEDLRGTPYKKAMVFTCNTKHCNEVCEMLMDNSIKCVPVHSKLDGKEEYNLLQYTHGLISVCVSVGMLTKGYDYPPIDLTALLFATTSLSKYLQCIGRASRVLKGEEVLPIDQRKKKFFTVLDYGENCTRHLPWDWERDWQTLWKKRPKKKGVPPIKVCPRCDFVNSAQAKICQNCGYAWSSLDIQVEQNNTETILVEITAKYSKLVGRTLSSLTPEELSIYAKSKNKNGLAQRIAKWHSKTEPTFLYEFAKHMGYKPYWAKFQSELISTKPIDDLQFKDVELK